jgi:hypothetical protein
LHFAVEIKDSISHHIPDEAVSHQSFSPENRITLKNENETISSQSYVLTSDKPTSLQDGTSLFVVLNELDLDNVKINTQLANSTSTTFTAVAGDSTPLVNDLAFFPNGN